MSFGTRVSYTGNLDLDFRSGDKIILTKRDDDELLVFFLVYSFHREDIMSIKFFYLSVHVIKTQCLNICTNTCLNVLTVVLSGYRQTS